MLLLFYLIIKLCANSCFDRMNALRCSACSCILMCGEDSGTHFYGYIPTPLQMYFILLGHNMELKLIEMQPGEDKVSASF